MPACSGTAFGTIVLHVAPESAVGGPLAAVRNGDRIRLSEAGKSIRLLVDDAEIARRLASLPPRPRAEGAATRHFMPAPCSRLLRDVISTFSPLNPKPDEGFPS